MHICRAHIIVALAVFLLLGDFSSSAQAIRNYEPARLHSNRTSFTRLSRPGIPWRVGMSGSTVSPIYSSLPSHKIAGPAFPLGYSLPLTSIFFAPNLYGAGLRAQSTVAGDVNGDGVLDLITTSPCSDINCSMGLVSVSLGNGDGTFRPAVSYPSGGPSTQAIATTDLNSDGKLDIVVTNQCSTAGMSGCVAVLIGNGDGSFEPAVTYDLGGLYSNSVAVGDVNGDGKPDLAVATGCVDNSCFTGSVAVLLGNGDGTFQQPVTYTSGGINSSWVGIDDVNGDGRPDLVAINTCSTDTCMLASVVVLLGKGDGTFQPATSYSTGCANTYYGGLADLNGDGKVDVVVVSDAGCSATLLGNGDGTLKAPLSFDCGGFGISVAIADVNSDGKPDLAVENVPGSVSLMLGNGDGTFQPPVSYASGGFGSSAMIADVNSDGKPDLILTNQCSDGSCQNGSIAVLLGNGGGTFQGLLGQAPGQEELAVAVGDVNGDGQTDLIVADGCFSAHCDEGGVKILLGKGDGTFQTFASYALGATFPQAIAMADVTGDGKPDIIVASLYADSDHSYLTGGILSVLLGNGDGSFQPAVAYASGGNEASSIEVGDVNGDGRPDLIATNICVSGSDCTVGSVSILLGNADGTFQPANSFRSGGQYALSAIVKDINRDGKPDIMVLNECADASCTNGTVDLFLGNGDASFQPPVSYRSGVSSPYSLALADMNNDGNPDVILASSGDASITCNGGLSVLPGNRDGTFQQAIQSAAPCISVPEGIAIADYDGDGNLDVASLSANALLLGKGDGTFQAPVLLGAPGYGTATGDFNQDGKPDLAVASGAVLYVLTNRASGYRYQTSIGLSSSRNPTMLGQTVTLSANITPAFSVGVLGGTVTFYDGANVLGTEVLVNGQATFTTSVLALGAHAIMSAYGGDSNYLPSKSSTLTETVVLRTTKTSIKSSLNPALVGDAVTFTAVVTSPIGRPPDGSMVTFADGGVMIGSAVLANGKGALTIPFSTIGPHFITASYQGATNYAPSTSTALTEKVRAATSTSLVSSPNPSAVGQRITFTANVTSAYGVATGSVTFRANGILLGTKSVSGGSAILKISTLGAGTFDVTATFNGSAYFVASSGGLTQVVQ